MLYLNYKRVIIFNFSFIITFLIIRIYLNLFPHTNLDIGSYNIHHLFIGLLLITFGTIPLIIFEGNHRLLDFASILLGIGLSLSLDQWFYLIMTDGSDDAYLLPISLWGGVGMICFTLVYLILLIFFYKR